MGNPYPAEIIDSNGFVKAGVEITFTDSQNQPGGSNAREQIRGNAVTIANGATGSLTWDTKLSGSDLLDLTDPANPAVITAGVYAVTIRVGNFGLTVGGTFFAEFDLDLNGEDPEVIPTSPPSVAGQTHPTIVASMTYYIPAGGVINVTVGNNDGANAVDFTLFAVVQRVS